MPVPDRLRPPQRLRKVLLRAPHRVRDVLLQRQERRDRRRRTYTLSRACSIVSIRGDENSRKFRPSNKTSTAAGPSRCPPFTTTTRAPSANNSRAALRTSPSVRTGCPTRSSASGTFGVKTSASGKSSSRIAFTASSRSRRSPLFATITGSTTRNGKACCFTFAATTSMIAAFASIPVFTASGRMSSTTASICAATNAGGASCIAVTPIVFCAVSAVIAVVPYTPSAAHVFRSAWIPAPALESEPAMIEYGTYGINDHPSPALIIRGRRNSPCQNASRSAQAITRSSSISPSA